MTDRATPKTPVLSPFPFGIVGFDLDGTLFDTSHELCASLNHALATIGRAPVPQAEMRLLVGRGALEMLRRGLARTGGGDEPLALELFPVLIAHYAAHLGSNCVPFPGLIAAMNDLAARGVTLAVVTNKLEHLAVTLLTNLGLIDRFACVLGGDTLGLERMKPKPDLLHEMIARCVATGATGPVAYIGDSEHDTHAASAAGIPCIAVSFGYSAEPVTSIGASAVIDHYDELLPMLERIAAPAPAANAI